MTRVWFETIFLRICFKVPENFKNYMSKGFNTPEKVIYVCTGSKCKKKGGKEIGKSIREKIKDLGLKGKVEVVKTDCTDRCDYAPVVCLQPANSWLSYTTEQTAKEAFEKHILNKE